MVFSRHALDELVDVLERSGSHLHLIRDAALRPDADPDLLIADLLDTLAPLASAYRTWSSASSTDAPARPWPPGTLVRTIRNGSSEYGVVLATSLTTVTVQYSDHTSNSYAYDDVTWVSRPCPTTLALIGI